MAPASDAANEPITNWPGFTDLPVQIVTTDGISPEPFERTFRDLVRLSSLLNSETAEECRQGAFPILPIVCLILFRRHRRF